ncbi:DUF3987 domain-containing protein [Kamptonema sp. UHCC 0994]|uniref:DUF3987 domain-containing protein n=1 Tax=Kamptonema sp. UHCC 0994 TaxID=3031329 RepID=UPI0023B8A406|nr:DUF3987 domain-containing protein [Kamptonema sp. UHCC 0994]MDF0553178.1 DUF3987 domain-containing protein [Kamptonema sp. UHCC 0994]
MTAYNSNTNSFDIRNFTDKLTHVKGEKYICPVCGNNNLSISKKNGAYQCWNGCQNKDIREALAPPETNTKPVRPAGKSVFLYDDREGNNCVRVTRIDDGKGHKDFPQSAWDGKKWQSNLDGLDRSRIPCYRYQEVRAAIAQGNPIFICEGEGVADSLWEIGIAATTFIGGSGNYRKYGSYRQDLEGAKLVLCPDRDEPGLAYMKEISEDFPDAQWCYAPPSDFFWARLPKNRGLDIKDWIGGGATAAQILELVGQKKKLKAEVKVITHPNFAQPDIKGIGADIDSLIAQDLRRSQLLIAISELAQKYKMAENAIQKIYNTRVEELEREDARGDVKAEIESLLAAQKSSIKLSEIFPEKLAKPIERLASILNLKPECFAIALLTQTSSLFKVGTETMLYPQTKYRCTPNYFGAIVANISQKKSPIFRAIITDPMLPLLQAAREEYREKLEEYEAALAEWKAKKDNRGAEPIKPRPKVYSFSKATGESIPCQVQHFPLQSLMWTCDELAGFLKSSNQYRGGKGSDEEDLLEYWNGGTAGTKVLRTEGLKVDLDRLYLSIFGTIQPSVLADFLSQEDKNGKFARFDFVSQPPAACELSMDMPNVDLSPMLCALYQKIDSLPPIKFELSLEARRKFIAFYNDCEQRRVRAQQEQDESRAGMIGKMPEKVGKLLTCIHTIHSLFNGDEVSPVIESEAVVAAIQFVRFTELQITSIRTEIGSRQELAPSLARVIAIAARKGAVTIRDIVYGFSSRCRPSSSTVKIWVSELLALGLIVTVADGKFTVTEKCGSSGSNAPIASPAKDTTCSKSGSFEPDLVHQSEKMNQMNQNEPDLEQGQSFALQKLQLNEPDEPEKTPASKNTNDESADSVTVGAIKILNKKQKLVDVPVNVTEAITDTKFLEEGDKIVSPGGTGLVEIYAINKKWISLAMTGADKPMIQRGMPKARWVDDFRCVVSHKEFKEWVDPMSLRVVKAAIPEIDTAQADEPHWQPGQKLKLRVTGQMRRDVVEFVKFHFTAGGIAMAIVNWMGKQQMVPLDRLSEAG